MTLISYASEPPGFDYSALAEENAALVRDVATRVRAHQRRTSAEIIEVGADLARVKGRLDHGQFGRWLDAEFGWTIRTAQNYMRAAEVFGVKCETVSHLPPKAIYMLSAKSVPEAIVGEVVGKIENGEPIDLDAVTDQVRKASAERSEAKRKSRLKEVSARTRKRREKEQREWEHREAKRQAEAEAAARDLVATYGLDVVLKIAEVVDKWDVQKALRKITAERLPSPAHVKPITDQAETMSALC